MIGPQQRRSLLDGDLLRRNYAAQNVLDQFLDRVIDAFDFQIADTEHTSATDRSTLSDVKATDAYTQVAESTPKSRPRAQSFSFLEKRNAMIAVMNEKLCAWFLNATPAGEKSNPLELGWSKSSLEPKPKKLDEEEDIVFHCDEELPLQCEYSIMTC